MIDDPYKILEVSRSADADEVKRAYRRKAKEFHPDMHPDDPDAGRKMNEINEAYDMIMNPEKYRQRRAQQEQQRQYSQQAGQTYDSGYESDSWAGNFGFEDFFRGFGGYGTGIPRPEPRAGDSPRVAAAVNLIRQDAYRQALEQLIGIGSTLRDARWYYLSALANYGLGNRVAAWEYIRRACDMDPGSMEYAAAKQSIGRDAQTYGTRSGNMQTVVCNPTTLCFAFCAAQICCGSFCRYGFYR